MRPMTGGHPRTLPVPTVLLCIVLLAAPLAAQSPSPTTPEGVVRANAAAWQTGDSARLLSLFADDARGYDRSSDPLRLEGRLSETIGSKERLAAYYKTAAAKPPLSQETVVDTAAVGDLVIAAGESFTPPNGARMAFLTGYRVNGGLIRDLWHLAWTRADATLSRDTRATIDALIAARQARDADRVNALFAPDAQRFRYSNNSRTLADAPSSAPIDDTSSPINIVKVFAVGDLAVVQSEVTGQAGAPAQTVTRVTIYRISSGRITAAWLIGEQAR